MEKITSIEDLLLVMLIIVMLGVTVALLFFIAEISKLSKRIVAEKTGKEIKTFDFNEWWTGFVGRRVAIENEESIMLDHDYDGIKELDNHLPPWWTGMFYASIVFAVVYMLVYHVFDAAPLPAEEYTIEMEKAKKEQEANLAKLGNSIDEKSVALMQDNKAAIANGKVIYDANCIACHGPGGEGTVGPNLTDDFWLHGGSINDIFRTIKVGVPEKGMISWKDAINPKDMQDVSNFIISLHGTNPPNAKAAEGEKYEATATTATADSTVAG